MDEMVKLCERQITSLEIRLKEEKIQCRLYSPGSEARKYWSREASQTAMEIRGWERTLEGLRERVEEVTV